MSYLVFRYFDGLQMKTFETIEEAESDIKLNGGYAVKTLDLKLIDSTKQGDK